MTIQPPGLPRRRVLQSAAGLAVAAGAPAAVASAPLVGKPGDFDFLTGE